MYDHDDGRFGTHSDTKNIHKYHNTFIRSNNALSILRLRTPPEYGVWQTIRIVVRVRYLVYVINRRGYINVLYVHIYIYDILIYIYIYIYIYIRYLKYVSNI